MTAAALYEATLRELARYNTMTMTEAEFNYHIQVTQHVYTKDRYDGLDEHQKQVDDLRFVHKQASVANTGGTVPRSERFVLPADFLHLTNCAFVIRYFGVPCFTNGSLSKPIVGTPLSDDRWQAVDRDYYSNWDYNTVTGQSEPLVHYQLYQDGVKVKALDCVATEMQLTYLQVPPPITVDPTTGASVSNPVWDDAQCIELAQLCCKMYLETIEENRWQTNTMEQQQHFQQSPLPNQPR